MLSLVVLVIVSLGVLVAVGISRGWRLDSWSLALALFGWALVAAAAVTAFGTPEWPFQRAIQHRQAAATLALSAESILAAGALALASRPRLRRRATVAGWLVAGWIGVLIAIVR
jgi:hypothetical protein